MAWAGGRLGRLGCGRRLHAPRRLSTGERRARMMAVSCGPHAIAARSGPREDATRIGSAGVVRRQAVDISPLRRVNQVRGRRRSSGGAARGWVAQRRRGTWGRVMSGSSCRSSGHERGRAWPAWRVPCGRIGPIGQQQHAGEARGQATPGAHAVLLRRRTRPGAQSIWLLTTGAREAAFRNIKTVAECLADELVNAAKGSSNRCGGMLWQRGRERQQAERWAHIQGGRPLLKGMSRAAGRAACRHEQQQRLGMVLTVCGRLRGRCSACAQLRRQEEGRDRARGQGQPLKLFLPSCCAAVVWSLRVLAAPASRRQNDAHLLDRPLVEQIGKAKQG